jgi:predicted RNA-binding protein
VEQIVIDFNIRKEGTVPKEYSGTGNEIKLVWENLEKFLGTYWFKILKKKRENPDKEIIIENLNLNFIPLAVYFNLEIDLDSVKVEENNILNCISPHFLYQWSKECQEKGILRDLVEMISCSSVKLSDILYQLDFSDLTKDEIPEGPVYQNSWQSYGRTYIRAFHKKVLRDKKYKQKCMLMPCTKSRPYYSKSAICLFNNRKDFQQYFNDVSYEKIVMSNIGLVPEKYWEEKLILNYLAGVPDIWRLYKLAEEFFGRNKFEEIVCFVEFPPYIEIMEILEKKYNLNIKYFIPKKYRYRGAKFAINKLVG